ncbi:kinase-like domain-containing protein [Mycena metata]|uniref:Kinase-like domain-containing protein n=1 Tax=Mycena metata TaxID=1033252 RepID=A0AAD7JTY8_9AGAR|nr:kinase-like domain-containing protein [Mycena metata]
MRQTSFRTVCHWSEWMPSTPDIWRGIWRRVLCIARWQGCGPESYATFLRKCPVAKYSTSLVWRDLHHPHILPFIGIDRDTFPSLAIVSPWMEQGTVLNHLDRHGHADIDKLLFQIAQGIGYLHSRNIVHGDLRGANILVNDNWTACLADFGLSNFTDPISTASSTKRAGSLYWMAPELLDPNRYGRKFVRTPATDVYAFGCVCVELYTGRPPLSDLPGPAVIFPILNGERAPRPMGPPAMSDTLWQNVTKYWAADPEARPPSDIMTQQMVWPALEGEDRLDPEARPSSDIITQQMVWPALEGEDGLVAAGVMTPPLEITSRRCQYPIKCFSMNDPKEGEPLPVEHTVAAGHPEEDVNGTRSIEVEESEALTSEARSSAEPKETALIKEKSPGELQVSSFEHPHNEVGSMDKGEKKSALKSLIHWVKKPILTPGLKRAIKDGSPTETLLSFVEKGADVNVQAKGSPVYFDSPWRPSTALQVAAYSPNSDS